MLIATHEVMLYAQFYTWSDEALCSLLKMELSYMLITVHGVRLYDHCYTRSEAVCSLL